MYILSINHLKLLVKLTKYAIQANTLICKYPHRGAQYVGSKLWGPSCGAQAVGSKLRGPIPYCVYWSIIGVCYRIDTPVYALPHCLSL